MTILVEHNPEWKLAFAEFAHIYRAALGDLILGVEHVGSTAIVGIAAKPIIDIDLVMSDCLVLPAISERLAKLGYRHNGDQGVPQREAFKRVDENSPWTGKDRAWMRHHLYACPQNSHELWRHTAFRDYLNQHKSARLEYERIKLDIESRSGGERKVYVQIKETEGTCRNFIESILAKAKR